MSGWDGGAIRDVIGRRTPEGVAPGPVGHPIVTGATALGFAVTAGLVGGIAAALFVARALSPAEPLRLLSAASAPSVNSSR